jgi:hypothetical protein
MTDLLKDPAHWRARALKKRIATALRLRTGVRSLTKRRMALWVVLYVLLLLVIAAVKRAMR